MKALSQIGQGRIGKDRDRTERLRCSGVVFRSRQIIAGSRSESRNRKTHERSISMDAIVFILCNSGIVQLEVREIWCCVAGEAVADFAGKFFVR